MEGGDDTVHLKTGWHSVIACGLMYQLVETGGNRRSRWRDLINARFDVLLYDLTSTYFEIDPPLDDGDERRFGYSRDRRFDCVQVMIALIVMPEGLPIAYDVLAGNTADKALLMDNCSLHWVSKNQTDEQLALTTHFAQRVLRCRNAAVVL